MDHFEKAWFPFLVKFYKAPLFKQALVSIVVSHSAWARGFSTFLSTRSPSHALPTSILVPIVHSQRLVKGSFDS